MAGVLGRLLGDVWGPVGFWFMVGAVYVTFCSTTLSVQDGFGRMFGNGLGVIEMEEMAIRFALKCFEGLILEQRKAVDVSMDGYERFNAERLALVLDELDLGVGVGRETIDRDHGR